MVRAHDPLVLHPDVDAVPNAAAPVAGCPVAVLAEEVANAAAADRPRTRQCKHLPVHNT